MAPNEEKQGAFAVATGAGAENTIRCILSEGGYVVRRHYPLCQSIYGHPLKTDFYLPYIQTLPNGLAIECKWQDCGGSVDEKYPYLVLNIKEKFPCPAIVVIDGGGYKQGAFEWLKEQVDNDHLIAVFNLAEFLTWVNREMPQPTERQARFSKRGIKR